MAAEVHITPSVQAKICDALRAGNTRTAAAGCAGISRATFYRFLTDETFKTAIEKAEDEAEAAMVDQIGKAADSGTWTAAAWWLERRRYQDWGRRDRLEHSGKDGEPIEQRVTLVWSDVSRAGGSVDAEQDVPAD